MSVGVAPNRVADSDPRRLAAATARRFAAAVDAENRFPVEAVDVLRDGGLLGLLVPSSLGGGGGTLSDACAIAAELASGCLSTGLIWAMHSQQVLIMADHGADQWSEALSSIARRGLLVASATSEPGKSGLLLRARAPLVPVARGVRIERASPFVSYGAEAEWFLVTMRGDSSAAETDARYVLLEREEGEVIGDWRAMGMRGTRSVPMRFDATVPAERILRGDFRDVAAVSAVPAAHLGWSSAWYGAAKGALERFVHLIREGGASERRRLASDLFLTRLGEARLGLDLMHAMLARLTDRYEQMRAASAPPAAYRQAAWTIALNGLKVACSRQAYEVVDALVTMGGLARGYVQDEELALERTLRDLRSAALMVGNHQLLQLNAQQIIFGSGSTEKGDARTL